MIEINDDGIVINDDIKLLIDKSVNKFGTINKISSLIGVTRNSVATWHGEKYYKNKNITTISWNNVEKIRDFFEKIDLIDNQCFDFFTPYENAKNIIYLRSILSNKTTYCIDCINKCNDGLEIVEDIRCIIEKAIDVSGNVFTFSKKSGITYQNIKQWEGKYCSGNHKGNIITWSQVYKLRPYLEELGLIDKGDVEWMTPTERRQEVIRLREELKKKEEMKKE